MIMVSYSILIEKENGPERSRKHATNQIES